MAIYVILDKQESAVKIGFSKIPSQRVAALQTANSKPLNLLGVNAKGEVIHERTLHRHLSKWRLNGEWFSYTPEVKAVCEKIVLGWLPNTTEKDSVPSESDDPRPSDKFNPRDPLSDRDYQMLDEKYHRVSKNTWVVGSDDTTSLVVTAFSCYLTLSLACPSKGKMLGNSILQCYDASEMLWAIRRLGVLCRGVNDDSLRGYIPAND